MNQDTPKADYLAQNVSELARQRGPATSDPNLSPSHNRITRTVAKRLLPACVATPAALWFVLMFCVHRAMFPLETAFILFVFSVTVVFGLIVCLNLHKMSRMEAERTRAQELLQRAKEAAENANRFKSAFFANISHEIRTPLTAINGFAELLLSSDRSEEERRSDAKVIRRNGEHLLTLINDILDQSKIEAGKMSVEPLLCCPARVIGEVQSMLRGRANEKGVALEVNFQGPTPSKVRTDPTRLRQILINLVANAIKFTKDGSVTLEVAIKPAVTAANPILELKITDTGIGMTQQQQALLFKPFVQADASISRHYGGSGLGLSISRYFAQALGGDIVVTSQAGKGSTFTVTVSTGSLNGVKMHDNPHLAMESHDDFAGPKVKITGTVLVAEDGIDNQALIAAKLRETGLKVELASNGKIACEKVRNALTPFDLILMDVQMPEMDGFAATLHLRGGGYRGPIIALTANATERDRSKCLNAGCNDFVTKPIRMEALLKAMGRYLKITEATNIPVNGQAAPIHRDALAKRFCEELPDALEQVEQAVEREDRVQLKEAAQLLLGKSSAAGLKEIAAQAARLLHLAESEQSWEAIRETATKFVRDAQPKQELQAA
jgi:signal transduction histidine kinase/CheY-like chemotaxis protein/HPt (histidine-containing phosphotransfer) domain-containing protein